MCVCTHVCVLPRWAAGPCHAAAAARVNYHAIVGDEPEHVNPKMASSGSWILQTIQSVISELDNIAASSNVSLSFAEALEYRIELVYRDMIAKEASGELNLQEQQALPLIATAFSNLRLVVENLELLPPQTVQPVLLLDGSVGRPRYGISYHQLETLISMNLTVPRIAQLLGVSVSTVRRRMREYDLSIRETYSNITDASLDAIVSDVHTQFPGWGNRLVYGWLVSHGIRVQFERVRESQRRIDPEGSMLRRLHRVCRRRYAVQGPRYLWHIDGNHKLIRYIGSITN